MKRKTQNKSVAIEPQLPNDLVEMKARENLMRNDAILRSEIPTPKKQIKQKDGKDYVEEAWMRHMLNKHFPNWSWVHSGDNPVQFLGGEWVYVAGTLIINDNGVQRHFFSPGSARVQFKKESPHTPENVINIDYNIAAANANAFKRAVNRLCNIADDVYRKQILDLGEEQLAIIRELFDNLKQQQPKKNKEIEAIERNLGTKIKAGSVNVTNYEMFLNEVKNEFNYKENN
jgi:hypothetical protein|tara:strand:+ start:848 stop:1537 length:690 start_codon:yes stop_codon:yes gene_type:complete